MDRSLLCFAYGSNMSRTQVAQRCPDAIAVGTGVLRDHRIAFTRWSPAWEGGVADVVTAPGHSVWGLLWSMTGEDLAALDAYEGHPVNYRRSRRTIDVPGQRGREAWVYEVVEKKPFVTPARDYLQLLLTTMRSLGFPDTYVDAAAAAAAGRSS